MWGMRLLKRGKCRARLALSENAKRHWSTLGHDRRTWGGGLMAIENLRIANGLVAKRLGYASGMWGGYVSGTSWADTPALLNMQLCWHELTDSQRLAALSLCYSEQTWNEGKMTKEPIYGNVLRFSQWPDIYGGPRYYPDAAECQARKVNATTDPGVERTTEPPSDASVACANERYQPRFQYGSSTTRASLCMNYGLGCRLRIGRGFMGSTSQESFCEYDLLSRDDIFGSHLNIRWAYSNFTRCTLSHQAVPGWNTTTFIMNNYDLRKDHCSFFGNTNQCRLSSGNIACGWSTAG